MFSQVNELANQVIQRVPRLAIESWLSSLGDLPPVRGRVLITALRNYTWIEWAAYSACVLRQIGFETTLLYRRTQIRQMYRAPRCFNFWTRVISIPGIELINLESLGHFDDPELLSIAMKFAPSIVAYDFHIEEADVFANPLQFEEQVKNQAIDAVRMGFALQTFLKDRKFHRFFCYSGLIGESPVLLEIARRTDLITICLEGWSWRPGHMIYNLNAPALEYNVLGWMQSFGNWDNIKEKEINAYLKFIDNNENKDSGWLKNFHRIQRNKISEELPIDLRNFLHGEESIYLAAPNVIGDSSTLHRETIFPSMQIWLRELINWFRFHPNMKLIIRSHPAEIWVGSKCVIHTADIARKFADGASNILILDSNNPVNTFTLIPFVQVGLCWMSSAGADFVVRGLPTIVAAKPKYSGLNIVEEPDSQVAYFNLLKLWANCTPKPTFEQVIQAKRYLYMVFKGFSFESAGRTYRADSLRLGKMPSQSEHDQFFRILVGDEPMPDRPNY